LRIDYINIQRNEKRIQKNLEMHQLITMYSNCMTDLLYRLHDNVDLYDTIEKEMIVLKTYINNCFSKIKNSYNSSTLFLNEHFKFESEK
jgi:hypothetical protein